LKKNPDDRYQNLDELMGALAPIYKKYKGEEFVVGEGEGDILTAAELVNKGSSLDNLGFYEEAIECYDRAIEIDDRDSTAYYNKAHALDSLQKFPEAIDEYENAIGIMEELRRQGRSDILNDLAAAYMNKGNALQQMHQLPEAVLQYEKAIGIMEDLVNNGYWFFSANLFITYFNYLLLLRRNEHGYRNRIMKTGKSVLDLSKSLISGGNINEPILNKMIRAIKLCLSIDSIKNSSTGTELASILSSMGLE